MGLPAWTCALYRPHVRQYIALHKKGKLYFAMHTIVARNAPIWEIGP
jgi:hypothetical protein